MKKIFFFLAALMLSFTAQAKVTIISPDAENDALRLAVHYAEDGDIIEMTEGTYVQCNNGYVAFDGKAVTVRAAEGANVILQPQVRITLENGGKATFQNIKIDASRIHDLADWYEHVFYAADATEGKALVMEGCEFYGFNLNKSAIYSKADNKLALCEIKDCYFHDNMKSCLFFEGESLSELSVTNSTFANIATDASGYYAGVIDVRSSAAKVTVDHCTFYNCLLMNTDYAAVTMKGPQAANVVISNNIFMLPEAIDGHRAIRNDVEATNCMTFNYVKDNGGIHSSVTKTNCFLNVDPMFVDAANGNFALAEGSPAIGAATDGSNLGDPRWNATEEPEEKLPAASVRAWAYDLALAVEGEEYTFSYKATTAAKASLIFTDADGVELAIVDLGVVEAGANSKVLAASELPAGKKVNWAVKLEAGAIAEFTEVTDASRGIYNFYLPQGVAVDNNPESATFGTIYVAAATDGASDGGSDRADTQKRGIFIYDQELNELNPTNVGVVPSNVTFGATSRQVMKRLVINPATNEVAFAHNAAPMAVWAVPAENVGGEAKNLIEGLGFTNVNSLCFGEDGTLYVLESNGYPAPGSLYKVVDGVVDTLFAGNTRFGNGDNALVSDNRGGIWICQNRGQLDAFNQLTHVNAAGEIDYEVNTTTPNGFESMNTARGTIAYNPAEDILAMSLGTGSTIGASLYKVTYDEATGVPALTLIGSTPSMGKNVDGLAFDYAGDLYGLSANKERLYKYAVPTENNVCTTPAASKYAFEIVEPVEIVGVVKRAIQNGDAVIVLTHEEDGTAHIYNVVDGVAVSEISQEGVVARDPENAGDLLAISDIALTEDGKLVASNKIVCQAEGYVDAGYKRGEFRVYIWNDLHDAPSILLTSKMSSNWFRSVQGHTIAYKGTSTNGTLFTTGVTATGVKFRYSVYNVIEGVYTDPAVNDSEHFHFTKGDAQTTDLLGNYELVASPLGDANWILDGDLVDPFEIVDPLTYNSQVTVAGELAISNGKKFNGASIIEVEGRQLLVAPYANEEGLLLGVQVLNITNGFAAAEYVDLVTPFDAPMAATAVATAVKAVENGLEVTLVVDNAIHMTNVGLEFPDAWEVYEDEITNLVIDLDNLVLIGGPSSAFQVDVFLGLGEYNRNDDTYQLIPESSIAVQGSDATFIEGWAYEVDAFTPSAKAVVRCEWNGMLLEFHLTMTAAPLEATVVVVENALVEIEKYLLWGDMYDYALKMSGEWVNPADGLTYPVLVEVPVYYPEATEPSEIMSTVTVGGWGDNDPWLGFGEGTLTVTTVNDVVTATGIVQNPMAGVAIDITISGKIIETALENVETTVAPVKVIKNGQLIITKDGVEYNAQGAVVK